MNTDDIVVDAIRTTIIWCYKTDCKFCSGGRAGYGVDMYGKFGSCTKKEIEIGKDSKCKSYEKEEIDIAEVYREAEDIRAEIRTEDDGEY
jgi:hypothetical protein